MRRALLAAALVLVPALGQAAEPVRLFAAGSLRDALGQGRPAPG